MREVKFNVYDKITDTYFRNDEYYFEVNFYSNMVSVYRMIDDIRVTTLDFEDNIECELIQNTGLKDINNKEIYEDDICLTYEKNEHLFNEEIEIISWIDKDENGFGIGWGLFPNTFNYEVIGNKYENPELLEKSYEQ